MTQAIAQTWAVPIGSAHIHPAKGAGVMRKKIEKPNIVETYNIGGSTIHIADNFIRKDPDEIERIIDEFHAIGWMIHQEFEDKAG